MRLREQSTIVVSYFYGIYDLVSPKNIGRDHLLVGGGFLAISMATFILNEFVDKKGDLFRLDRQPSRISALSTLFLVSCFSSVGLLLGFLGGAPACTAGIWLCGLLYSFPGIHLKTIAVLDLFSLGLCFVILPYCGSREIIMRHLGMADVPRVSLLNISFLISFLLSCNFIAMIRDYEADCLAGFNNTTIRLGMRNSLRLGLSSALVAHIIGAVLVYERTSWWYFPVVLFAPIVASIYGFGLGAKSGQAIHSHFAASARIGIAVGNLLAILLLMGLVLLVLREAIGLRAGW
jgi:4-hydroxybenzoate polyprenyltransferase